MIDELLANARPGLMYWRELNWAGKILVRSIDILYSAIREVTLGDGVMKIEPFELERYFANHEFSAPFILSASDCESLSLQELLDLADSETSQLWERLSLGYTESQGHPLLRQEISRLYQTITPDDVLIVAPEEGIFIAMQVLLEQGDHVIVTYPGYQSLYGIAEAIGCDVTRWALQASDSGWILNNDLLERSITSRTKLLVINFPHNPTGYLPPKSDLDAIVELARRHDITIFSDEMYWLLELDPARRLPAMCDLYEKGVSLFGLSKTFSVPGLRIGWLSTRDRALFSRLQAFKDYTTICSSAPSEVLSIMALRARDTIISRNMRIIRHNLDVAQQFCAARQDWFYWLAPRAGSVAFPCLTAGVPVDVFCQDLLAQQGVMIVPGELFQYPGKHFRLGLGRKNLPQGLERVGQYVERVGRES